jgi:Fe-S-cluster containining protein
MKANAFKELEESCAGCPQPCEQFLWTNAVDKFDREHAFSKKAAREARCTSFDDQRSESNLRSSTTSRVAAQYGGRL